MMKQLKILEGNRLGVAGEVILHEFIPTEKYFYVQSSWIVLSQKLKSFVKI